MRQRGIVVEKRSKSYPSLTSRVVKTHLINSLFAGQRLVGADVQASPDAAPANISVKSVLSVVKKQNGILPLRSHPRCLCSRQVKNVIDSDRKSGEQT